MNKSRKSRKIRFGGTPALVGSVYVASKLPVLKSASMKLAPKLLGAKNTSFKLISSKFIPKYKYTGEDAFTRGSKLYESRRMRTLPNNKTKRSMKKHSPMVEPFEKEIRRFDIYPIVSR